MKDNFGLWALNITSAVLAALVLMAFLGVSGGWFSLIFMVVATIGCSIGIRYLMDRHDAQLAARATAEQPDMWEARVNGVRVGTISDPQYADMKRTAFNDGDLALSQLFNVGRVAIVVLNKMVIVIPMAAFWAAIFAAIFAPEVYGEAIRELQAADPEAISILTRTLLELLAVSSLAAFIFLVMMGNRFGFRNYYGKAVNLMVRQQFDVAAEGDVTLFRTNRADMVASIKHKWEA